MSIRKCTYTSKEMCRLAPLRVCFPMVSAFREMAKLKLISKFMSFWFKLWSAQAKLLFIDVSLQCSLSISIACVLICFLLQISSLRPVSLHSHYFLLLSFFLDPFSTFLIFSPFISSSPPSQFPLHPLNSPPHSFIPPSLHITHPPTHIYVCVYTCMQSVGKWPKPCNYCSPHPFLAPLQL